MAAKAEDARYDKGQHIIESLLFVLNFRLTYIIFGDCNFCHTFRHTFPLFFVRLLSNEACEILKITFSHPVIINSVRINSDVNCFTATALLVCKKTSNFKKCTHDVSHCQSPTKHECCVSQGSVETLFR